MNKADLILVISEKCGFSKHDSKKAIEAFVEAVSKELIAGNSVRIAGFGSFKIGMRSERNGIIPATKEPIVIPARKFAKFTVGMELAEKISKQ